MNTTAQLKTDLISRIKNSEDIDFLRALKTIFDASAQQFYELSLAQTSAIEKGRAQIANGEFTDHDQVMQEMKSWLKK